MARCTLCWWADYNPTNPLLHQIILEPDYNAPMKPGGIPPDVRVVKSCGKDLSWFLPHNPIEHKCEEFKLFKIGQNEQQQADKVHVEAWSTPTRRRMLPPTTNLFLIIDRMAEGNKVAYDALVDFIGVNDMEGLTLTCYALNDMNIRGKQIEIAWFYAGMDVAELKRYAIARDEDMIAHINQHFEGADQEQAVKEGAARFGHKKSLLKK